MTHMTNFNPQGGSVLWEAQSNDLTQMATRGRVTTAAYRLTTEALYFASGVLSSREEVIPLWAIVDADVTQSMTQKPRHVSDLILKLDPAFIANFGQSRVVVRSIKDARDVRDLMLRQANEVRMHWRNLEHQRSVETATAGAANIVMGAPAAAQAAAAPQRQEPDFMTHLAKLGEMRAAGLLTEDEFTAAKAKLLA